MMKVPDDLARENLCKVFSGIAQRLGGARPEPESVSAGRGGGTAESVAAEESSGRVEPSCHHREATEPPPASKAVPRSPEGGFGRRAVPVQFRQGGGFLKGTTYRGSADFPGLSREAVLEGAARSLTADGWQITDTNKEAGSITAIQQPEAGGRDFTLKIILKPRGRRYDPGRDELFRGRPDEGPGRLGPRSSLRITERNQSSVSDPDPARRPW